MRQIEYALISGIAMNCGHKTLLDAEDVIDDFGVQRNTEWEMEILYNLIDARYANRRLTFVTTNQKADELKELAQGRIYSRFLEMCHIIHVDGYDFRELGNPEERWIGSQ